MVSGAGPTDEQLARLSKMAEEQLGLHFPPAQWADLGKRVGDMAFHLGFADAASCVAWLLESNEPRKTIAALARHLTIGETYFFRDPAMFRELEKKILPELLAARSRTTMRLSLWSAGCAGGEEAYSLAILLDRTFPFLKQWQISLYGSDINQEMLEKARRAVYSKWSLRGTPQWLQTNYFKALDGNNFQLVDHIRERVNFFQHNLVTGNAPDFFGTEGPADIILCRNVLMYFSEARRNLALDILVQVLAEAGVLFVSAGEAGLLLHPDLQLISGPQAVYFLRRRREGAAADRRCPEPPGGSSDLGQQPRKRPAAQIRLPAPPPRQSGAVPPSQAKSLPPKRDEQEALFHKAAVFYKQAQYGQCIALLKRTIEEKRGGAAIGTAPAEILSLLVNSYANLGELQEAEYWCDLALKTYRLDTDFRYLRATILQEQGRLDEALAELRHLLYLDPDCVVAIFAGANILSQQGKEAEAMKSYRTLESLLKGYGRDEELPFSDGLTAGRLLHVVQHMTGAVER